MTLVIPTLNITPICTSSQILFRRNARVIATDPMFFIGRVLMFWFTCFFFGIVYVESREREQSSILSRMWFSLWCIGAPTNMCIIG
jgi:hypothetical protein